jgi:Mrp family chromosome partitioning ATPase
MTAVSDALPLAQLVDDVLVVVRLGSSKVSRLWELRDLLAEQRSSPTGILLIGDSTRSGDRGYYGRADSPQSDIPDRERSKTDAERVLAPRQ